MSSSSLLLRDWGTHGWTIGFFEPDGSWDTVQRFELYEDAARHLHYLNGGSSTALHPERHDEEGKP